MSMKRKREILASVCAAVCLIAGAGAVFAGAHSAAGPGAPTMPDIPLTETEDLGNGLYTFRWGPYRTIFLVSDEGVVAADPLGTKAIRAYRDAIREVTEQPVTHVVYSHSHWDHVAGGALFKEEGASFISQEKCAENLRWSPNPDVVRPDITFDDYYRLSAGDKTIELYHYGPIHDNCMSVMLIKPANLIFVVDIVNPPTGRYLPFDEINDPDFHFGNAAHYLMSVENLAERNGVEEIIGSHLVPGVDESGEAIIYPSTGPVAALTERRVLWEQLLALVLMELNVGTPILSVHNEIDIEPFRELRGFSEEKLRRLLQRIAYFYVLGR